MKIFARFNYILFGILLGVSIVLVFLAGYRTIITKYAPVNTPQWAYDSKFVSTDKGKDVQSIIENVNSLKIQIVNLDEKVYSTNRRLDDFFIYGTVIITLLLAIIVGVYFRADAEVENYFKENHDSHIRKMDEYVEEAAGQLARINAFVSYTEKNLRLKDQEQIVPPDEIQKP